MRRLGFEAALSFLHEKRQSSLEMLSFIKVLDLERILNRLTVQSLMLLRGSCDSFRHFRCYLLASPFPLRDREKLARIKEPDHLPSRSIHSPREILIRSSIPSTALVRSRNLTSLLSRCFNFWLLNSLSLSSLLFSLTRVLASTVQWSGRKERSR